MRCPIESQENAELLLSYSARRLNPESTAILEAHMELCPACREFRDSQKALWEALDQWEARPVSPDFDRRLYRKIEEQDQLEGQRGVLADSQIRWHEGGNATGERGDQEVIAMTEDRLGSAYQLRKH